MLINFLRWNATYFFFSFADDTLRLTADRLNGDINDVDAPVRLLLSVAETQPFRIICDCYTYALAQSYIMS